ncbi:hypothetical protein Q5O89_20810 [Peribacillus frigoritolerans]|nr:hypothetical protein [Peribacillus frigoritolerans]
MSILPEKLDQVLGEDIYKREDKSKVNEALNSLEVDVSDTFREFYHIMLDLFGKSLYLLSY